ncbi:MAG: acyltransferase [Lysobacter sp.]|nr:MAG: acyltransferase [Lysobacter sp.]
MNAIWKQRPEGGGRAAIWMIRQISRHGGRRLGRLLLYPITLYFLLRRAPERRASREFLTVALGRPATLPDIARHIHTFASTILDRVFLLSGQLDRFDIRTTGLDAVHAQMDRGQGVLLLGSHLGSFDAMRVLATRRPNAKIRVVLDKAHSRAMQELLDALNPELAANIIDAGMSGPSIVLAIRDACEQGSVVALLVDRAQAHEPTVNVPFLGRPARFPTSPWLIAAMLKLPVVLAFSLYLGGNRYHLHFEVFSEGLVVERHNRSARIAECVQGYVRVLERYARMAPYNWFNFFDFWRTDHATDEPRPAAAPPRTAGDDPARGAG